MIDGATLSLRFAKDWRKPGSRPRWCKGCRGGGRLTALTKPSGGVRGIAASDRLRCLVARTLAQKFGPEAEAATQPLQFNLSTRAGTDAAGLSLRVFSELEPEAIVIIKCGRGWVLSMT